MDLCGCGGSIRAVDDRKLLTHLITLCLCHELAENVGQDTSMEVVLDFDWCIDSQRQCMLGCCAIGAVDAQCDIHTWRDSTGNPDEIIGFRSRDSEGLCALAILELQWQDAHADEV